MHMKVLLFGTGTLYEQFKTFFYSDDIVALMDNDSSKVGINKEGYEVLLPKDAIRLHFDLIFLLSYSLCEMKDQLVSLGVPKEKIYTFYDIYSVYKPLIGQHPLKIYCNPHQIGNLLRKKGIKIGIIGLALGRDGASIASLSMAKTLKKRYSVHMIVRQDGELYKEFIKNDIPVIIDQNLYVEPLSTAKWKNQYDVFIFNAMSLFTLFDQYTCNIPIVWWLHDSYGAYNGVPVYRLNEFKQGLTSVYAVSSVGIHAFREKCPLWNVEELHYGVNDEYSSMCLDHINNKVVFALIGSFQFRKAQDIFLEAIAILPEECRNQCEFWMIGSLKKTGSKRSCYIESVKQRGSLFQNVKIMDEVGHVELQRIYRRINVLVCPSQEDTMPIVCAEAMMHHHPCIVSDHVGTAEYIQHKENGMICRTGDAYDLARNLEWIIYRKEKIKEMGEKARLIYEKHFSMDMFEKNVFRIIGEKIQHL